MFRSTLRSRLVALALCASFAALGCASAPNPWICAATLGAPATRRKRRSRPSPFAGPDFACTTFSVGARGSADLPSFIVCAIAG
jgi:hypothetical protein